MITRFDKNVNQFLLNFHTLLIIQSFRWTISHKKSLHYSKVCAIINTRDILMIGVTPYILAPLYYIVLYIEERGQRPKGGRKHEQV